MCMFGYICVCMRACAHIYIYIYIYIYRCVLMCVDAEHVHKCM